MKKYPFFKQRSMLSFNFSSCEQRPWSFTSKRRLSWWMVRMVSMYLILHKGGFKKLWNQNKICQMYWRKERWSNMLGFDWRRKWEKSWNCQLCRRSSILPCQSFISNLDIMEWMSKMLWLIWTKCQTETNKGMCWWTAWWKQMSRYYQVSIVYLCIYLRVIVCRQFSMAGQITILKLSPRSASTYHLVMPTVNWVIGNLGQAVAWHV